MVSLKRVTSVHLIQIWHLHCQLIQLPPKSPPSSKNTCFSVFLKWYLQKLGSRGNSPGRGGVAPQTEARGAAFPRKFSHFQVKSMIGSTVNNSPSLRYYKFSTCGWVMGTVELLSFSTAYEVSVVITLTCHINYVHKKSKVCSSIWLVSTTI